MEFADFILAKMIRLQVVAKSCGFGLAVEVRVEALVLQSRIMG